MIPLEPIAFKAYNIGNERPDFLIDYCAIISGESRAGTHLQAPDEAVR
jgi:hypothetical protein